MAEAFKNLINAQLADSLGKLVLAVHPRFPYRTFLENCLPHLDALELKQRAILIGDALRNALPKDSAKAMTIVTRAIRQVPTIEEDRNQSGWLFFPINALLSRHGLDSLDASIELMRETTRRFTAEFAIRPFLIRYPDAMLQTLERWASDPDQHIRRLVSEGTRPRLPWAEQIPSFVKDPSPILPLLERLKDDPEEYVRRSVANNLNDISKDHPDRMLDLVERWLQKANPNRVRLLKHACRSLIKAGNARCLTLLGHAPPKLSVADFKPTVAMIALGDRLILTCALESTTNRSQNLIIDYRFHFVKANGKTAPKVFKGSRLALAGKGRRDLVYSIHLKPVTTRRYYSGETRIDLFVNGKAIAETRFVLHAN